VEIPSLGRRLAALIIDWTIAMLSAVALAGVNFPPAPLDEDASQTFIVLAFFIVQVGLLDGLTGQSIGKRLLGLRLENPDGLPIGLPRVLIRMILLCLFFPAIIMTDDKRGLHDLAAGSRVVRNPAAKSNN
jgi:uncharacterized RDD family membrane protein YckC